jgi:hypothetical protein
MPRKKKTEQPMTNAQQLGSIIKSARQVMRKDKGLSGDLDRLPILTWKINGIHFNSSEEMHTLSRLYETMLREMRDAAGIPASSTPSVRWCRPRPTTRPNSTPCSPPSSTVPSRGICYAKRDFREACVRLWP